MPEAVTLMVMVVLTGELVAPAFVSVTVTDTVVPAVAAVRPTTSAVLALSSTTRPSPEMVRVAPLGTADSVAMEVPAAAPATKVGEEGETVMAGSVSLPPPLADGIEMSCS